MTLLNGPHAVLTGRDCARIEPVLKRWLRERERLDGGGQLDEAFLDTVSDIAAAARAYRATAQVRGARGSVACDDSSNGAPWDLSERAMTTAEAATLLDVSERRVRGLIAESALRGRQRGRGGPWLIESGSVYEEAARRVGDH